MSGENHIKASADLRVQLKLQEAIDEICNNKQNFDDTTLVPALLQAFYAAHQIPDKDMAKALAQELSQHDPDIPSIQNYLP
jgi:hypothetical protein